MNEIDDSVVLALNELPGESNERVDVLISCCEKTCDALAAELSNDGAGVKQVISELDMLIVSITLKHLKLLESSRHVYAVELDQDVNARIQD